VALGDDRPLLLQRPSAAHETSRTTVLDGDEITPMKEFEGGQSRLTGASHIWRQETCVRQVK
jgi:hypothetical protein